MTPIIPTQKPVIRVSESGSPRSVPELGIDPGVTVTTVGSTGVPAVEPLVTVTQAGETALYTQCSPDDLEEIIDALEDAGADVHGVSVPSFHDGRPIKNALSFVELATHWRDGAAPYRRGGVDETLQTGFARARAAASGELSDFYTSKLLAGAQVVDAHDGRPYVRAQAARERLRAAFEDALDGVDALLLPTMPDVAPRIDSVGEWSYDYARNTRAANVTRLPAVTVPNGTASGLPVGLQLMGPAFDDARLLSVAAGVAATI